MKYFVFHGSTRSFEQPTDFSKLKSMDFGPGFYFAESPRDAERYGSVLYEARIGLNNPIIVSDTTIDDAFVRRFAKALKATPDDIQIAMDSGTHPIVALFELAKTLIDVGVFTHSSIRGWLVRAGYDGVIVEPNVINSMMTRGGATTKVHGKYFAVFSPEQIFTFEKSHVFPDPPTSMQAWHCGAKPEHASFDDFLKHLGSGEGMGILGPGIYFATSEVLARHYCKYSRGRKAVLYEATIDTTDYYLTIGGTPKRVRDRLFAALEEVGLDSTEPSQSSLTYGRGLIGLLNWKLGKKAAVQLLVKHRVRGALELLPSGIWEIAVFDPSTITVTSSEAQEAVTSNRRASKRASKRTSRRSSKRRSSRRR